MDLLDSSHICILSGELSDVFKWFELGIRLGVPDNKLKEIERNYKNAEGVSRCRVEVLSLWLRRTTNASWRNVVSALQQIEENALAARIQHKYIKGRPIPGSAHLTEEDSSAVAIARENQWKIKFKFVTFLKNSCRKLRGKQINAQEFRLFLKGLFPPGDFISDSSGVAEMFEAVTRNELWDFWNYTPLQQVVQEFVGDDQDVKLWIVTYRKDLASYKATTKLVDYIDTVDSDPSTDDSSSEEEEERAPVKYDRRYYRKLTIKLEAKFTSHTLEYLDDLWNEFADLHNLPPLVTLLDCVRKNSILIVWLIPSHLALHERLRAAPRSVDFYRKHQITKVEFDGACIYLQPSQDTEAEATVTEPVVRMIPPTEAMYERPLHLQSLTACRIRYRELRVDLNRYPKQHIPANTKVMLTSDIFYKHNSRCCIPQVLANYKLNILVT